MHHMSKNSQQWHPAKPIDTVARALDWPKTQHDPWSTAAVEHTKAANLEIGNVLGR